MSYRVNRKRQRRRSLNEFFTAIRSACYGHWRIPTDAIIPTPSEWGRFKRHLYEFNSPYRKGHYDTLIEWIGKNFIFGRDAGSTPADARLAAVIVAQHDGRNATWVAPSGEHGLFTMPLSVTTQGVYWTSQ